MARESSRLKCDLHDIGDNTDKLVQSNQPASATTYEDGKRLLMNGSTSDITDSSCARKVRTQRKRLANKSVLSLKTEGLKSRKVETDKGKVKLTKKLMNSGKKDSKSPKVGARRKTAGGTRAGMTDDPEELSPEKHEISIISSDFSEGNISLGDRLQREKNRQVQGKRSENTSITTTSTNTKGKDN